MRKELKEYAPDVRQPVERDPNQIFLNLPNIKSAQDKRSKRLAEMRPESQLEINAFLETKAPHKRRVKRT